MLFETPRPCSKTRCTISPERPRPSEKAVRYPSQPPHNIMRGSSRMCSLRAFLTAAKRLCSCSSLFSRKQDYFETSLTICFSGDGCPATPKRQHYFSWSMTPRCPGMYSSQSTQGPLFPVKSNKRLLLKLVRLISD